MPALDLAESHAELLRQAQQLATALESARTFTPDRGTYIAAGEIVCETRAAIARANEARAAAGLPPAIAQ